MKKVILSIITLVVVVFGITNLSYAAQLNNAAVTTLTDISAINKIEVHGNVALYISDASTDQVKVYNQYYSESALVQNKNGVLRITSYTPEKLVVWVSANDLRSVSAYDNSEVRSFGQLSKVEFNVELHDNSSAKLNLDAFTAKVTVSDFAKVDLTGSANELNLNRNFATTVISNNFKSEHVTDNKINFPTELNQDMVGI
jgi:hypothetical protein